MKFSPLGNNELENSFSAKMQIFVVPGLMDFCLYVVYNSIVDYRLYGRKALGAFNSRIMYRYILSKQKDIREIIRKNSSFSAPHNFEEGRKLVQGDKPRSKDGRRLAPSCRDNRNGGARRQQRHMHTAVWMPSKPYYRQKGMIRRIRDISKSKHSTGRL